MSRVTLALVAAATGALISVLGQEFHLWRQHRRRFDEARRVAYGTLISQAFRVHNAFAMTWSPATLFYRRDAYSALLDEVIAAVAAARLVASRPVQEAASDLMNSVAATTELATSILTRDARFGFVAWFMLGFKPRFVTRDSRGAICKRRANSPSRMSLDPVVEKSRSVLAHRLERVLILVRSEARGAVPEHRGHGHERHPLAGKLARVPVAEVV